MPARAVRARLAEDGSEQIRPVSEPRSVTRLAGFLSLRRFHLLREKCFLRPPRADLSLRGGSQRQWGHAAPACPRGTWALGPWLRLWAPAAPQQRGDGSSPHPWAVLAERVGTIGTMSDRIRSRLSDLKQSRPRGGHACGVPRGQGLGAGVYWGQSREAGRREQREPSQSKEHLQGPYYGWGLPQDSWRSPRTVGLRGRRQRHLISGRGKSQGQRGAPTCPGCARVHGVHHPVRGYRSTGDPGGQSPQGDRHPRDPHTQMPTGLGFRV